MSPQQSYIHHTENMYADYTLASHHHAAGQELHHQSYEDYSVQPMPLRLNTMNCELSPHHQHHQQPPMLISSSNDEVYGSNELSPISDSASSEDNSTSSPKSADY